MIKILAIDDKHNNLVGLTALFSSSFPDARIITALSGREGIEKALTEDPDVILLDLVMPIMDGIETCKRLKEDNFLKRIPVIMITATKTDSKTRTKALETGVEAFLSKPIDEAELTAQVSSMIRLKESENQVLLKNERLEERKRAETEQRKITERLSLACRAGGVGIWELDVVNNILIWDDQMFNLYGIKPDKFSGNYEAWLAGVHPEDLKKSEEELQIAMRGEKDFDTEFRVVWFDGTIHSIRALATVQRDASGQAGKIGHIDHP